MQKKYTFKGVGKGELRKPYISLIKWISPCFSFFLNTSIVVTNIFIIHTYTTTIITLKPYALNVKFWHFIPIFNKISSFMDTLKEGFEGENKLKDKVILWITLINTFTLTCPKTFTWGYVSDKYLHWPRVSVNLISLDMTYTYMGFTYHIYGY